MLGMVKTSGRKARRVSLLAAVIAACVAFSHSSPVQAANAEESALIEGAKLCTRYLPRHERQYGIPEHLLAAVASSESGRFHRGLGLNLPWPWTINVNGRGYFFDTKEEAVAAVNKFRDAGYNSIDVGCMQVNLRHHPKAFASVEQAFDPAYNVGYAASFLKRNFLDEGSWRKATAAYHSKTDSFGSPYAQRVFGAWSRIVSKVADARAGRPVLNPNPQTTAQVAKATTPARLVRPSYRTLKLRSISVTSNDKSTLSREKGVLVVRPKKSEGSDDIVFHNSPATPASESGKSVKVMAMKSSEAAAMDALARPQAAKPDNAIDAHASGAFGKPVKVINLSGNGATSSSALTPAAVAPATNMSTAGKTTVSTAASNAAAASTAATKGQFAPKARAGALDKSSVQNANKNMFVFDY